MVSGSNDPPSIGFMSPSYNNGLLAIFLKFEKLLSVRFDLAGLGFGGVEPEATGRPSYHPSGLLKLYIYGYLNWVQSSRRLEREAGRNIEVMWLTGRLAPGHVCGALPHPGPAHA
jgi:Transposase domain (DUF772)